MSPRRKLPAHLVTDPREMLERLVGLPEVTVLGLCPSDECFELHIESITDRPRVLGVRRGDPAEGLASGRVGRPAVRRHADGPALAQATVALR